jgi:hypothetical protein
LNQDSSERGQASAISLNEESRLDRDPWHEPVMPLYARKFFGHRGVAAQLEGIENFALQLVFSRIEQIVKIGRRVHRTSRLCRFWC